MPLDFPGRRMVWKGGALPFKRLYLAGTAPEIGIIEQASGGPPERKERTIDRWIRWDEAPPPEKEPEMDPAPEGPGVIRRNPAPRR